MPPLVREAISRREKDRDRALRNAQNKAANEKRQRTAPRQSPFTQTTKEEPMKRKRNDSEGWRKGALGKYMTPSGVKSRLRLQLRRRRHEQEGLRRLHDR